MPCRVLIVCWLSLAGVCATKAQESENIDAANTYAVNLYSEAASDAGIAVDLGEVDAGTDAHATLVLFNNSDAPTKLTAISTSCPCASAEVDRRDVSVNESAVLNVTIRAPSTPGEPVDQAVYVQLDGSEVITLAFAFHTREPVRAAYIGVEDLGDSLRHTIRLISIDGTPFRVLGVESGTLEQVASGDSIATEHEFVVTQQADEEGRFPREFSIATDHTGQPVIRTRLADLAREPGFASIPASRFIREVVPAEPAEIRLGTLSGGEPVLVEATLENWPEGDPPQIAFKHPLVRIDGLTTERRGTSLYVTFRVLMDAPGRSGAIRKPVVLRGSTTESIIIITARLRPQGSTER